jgi:uncharacterized protein YdhG (YjbR/CyaY superfamily)
METMEIRRIKLGDNITEIDYNKGRILISYKTPVDYYDYDKTQYFKTSKFWSRTTSKHINKWVGFNTAEEIDQDKLDHMFGLGL